MQEIFCAEHERELKAALLMELLQVGKIRVRPGKSEQKCYRSQRSSLAAAADIGRGLRA